MTLCDYFSAADDRVAAAVADVSGGPVGFGLDVVSLKGVDPVIAITRLEAILTGRTYDEASRGPRSGMLLSSPDEQPFVVSVSDALFDALAAATAADLVGAATPWSETDELRQSHVGSQAALEALEAVAALARRARSAKLRLYCWWAL